MLWLAWMWLTSVGNQPEGGWPGLVTGLRVASQGLLTSLRWLAEVVNQPECD